MLDKRVSRKIILKQKYRKYIYTYIYIICYLVTYMILTSEKKGKTADLGKVENVLLKNGKSNILSSSSSLIVAK